MHSIYPGSMMAQCVYNPQDPREEREQVRQCLYLSKFVVSCAKEAIREFEKKNVQGFDPLVRDRCCQVHALRILRLFEDESVARELGNLKERVAKILGSIDHKMNKVPPLKKSFTLEGCIQLWGLSVEVSAKVSLLLQAYLLTVASGLYQPRTIDYDVLRSRFAKHLDIQSIKRIVSHARTNFSRSSADFIRESAANLGILSESERKQLMNRLEVVRSFGIRDKMGGDEPDLFTPLTATCMLYNLKTVLLHARAHRLLLVLKEFRIDKLPEKRVFFRSEVPAGAFHIVDSNALLPGESALVFRAKLSEEASEGQLREYVEREGVEELLLLLVTKVEHFGSDNDLSGLDCEAQEEVASYVQRADSLSDRLVCEIVHAYPGRLGTGGLV